MKDWGIRTELYGWNLEKAALLQLRSTCCQEVWVRRAHLQVAHGGLGKGTNNLQPSPKDVLRDHSPGLETPRADQPQFSFVTFNQPFEGRDAIAQFGENGEQGTEMSGNVLEVTQLVRERAGTQTHSCLSKGGSDFKVWTVSTHLS